MRFLRFPVLILALLAPGFQALAAEPVLKVISAQKTLAFLMMNFVAGFHNPRGELN